MQDIPSNYSAYSLKDVHPTAFHRDSRYLQEPSSPIMLTKTLMVVSDNIFEVEGHRYLTVTIGDGKTESVLQELRHGGCAYTDALYSTGFLLCNSGVRERGPLIDFLGYIGVRLFIDIEWEKIEGKVFKQLLFRASVMKNVENKFKLAYEDEVIKLGDIMLDEMLPVFKNVEEELGYCEEEEELESPSKLDPHTYIDEKKAKDYVDSTHAERVVEMVALLINVPVTEKLLMYGDGAGTGYEAAIKLKRDVVAFDPSQSMVDLAKERGNKVGKAGKEVLLDERYEDRLVVVSHVMTVGPEVEQQISHRPKILIYEQKVFKGFSHYDKVSENVYKKGIAWRNLVPVGPRRQHRTIPTYRSLDVSVPGAVIKFSTGRYMRVLEYLRRESITIKVSIDNEVDDDMLLYEAVMHYGHLMVKDRPTLVLSDGPYIGHEPFVDMITGINSLRVPLYNLGRRWPDNTQFREIIDINNVINIRIPGPAYIITDVPDIRTTRMEKNKAVRANKTMFCCTRGKHRILNSVNRLIIDVK